MNNEDIDLTAARVIKNDNKDGSMIYSAPMEHEYKTSLHNCQVRSFQENSDLRKAETAAQQCFQPYLRMQEKTIRELSPLQRKFENCMRNHVKLVDEESESRNAIFQECLTQYKREVPVYNMRLTQLNAENLYRNPI
eukprot:TRINITY_DN1448_c0_g1_i3.p1 TRINITY_DN1448_c0_g1~~TRINITY_DN1448_c0_g1_i3.p1  ORF type:complete len:137 (-),score=22.50 TRINITY_DN1448_c0_g1_i3:134-544(-)